MPQVITRFAPSPTGHLHVGGARTALFCWALARQAGPEGRFILRVEDTDQARSSEAAARGILEDLAWLGIDWDEGPAFTTDDGRTLGGDPRGVGPFFQAQRLEIYQKLFDQLLESGQAYPAFDTPEELAAMRQRAEAEKRTFRYTQPEGYDHARALERMRSGEACVLRLRVAQPEIVVSDEVRGRIVFTPEHYDDFVIRKGDGFPTYHFAVVVDDELMGVTHVVRGEEHLNNTPKHVALQQALGYRTPSYAHLSLIANPDGSKMSKRDKDKAARAACKDRGVGTPPPGAAAGAIDAARFAEWLGDKKTQLASDQLQTLARALHLTLPEIEVEDFRRSGYLPETLCNYLALLGWNPGEKNVDGTDLERFDKAALAQKFGFERVIKKAASFDRAKLLAFNQSDIAAMPPETFESAWRTWAHRENPGLVSALGDRFPLAARAAQIRARTLADAAEPIAFALHPEAGVAFDEKAVQKVLAKNGGEGVAVLRELRVVLAGVSPFDPGSIDAAVHAFAEGRGLGMGKVAQPLRVAVTGGTVSPGLGETLALVGQAGVLRRIDRCVETHAGLEGAEA